MEFYLPLFLWTNDCERRGVNPFWELLEIISKCDSEALFDLPTDTETEVISKIERKII